MTVEKTPFPISAFSLLAQREAGHWWFRGRNRVLLWALRKKIGKIESFLEIGCGTGYVLEGVRRAYPDAKLYGVEYFEEGLAFARQRIPSATFRQMDATAMDEVDAYDVIGTFDVLEHIEQDELALRNMARALRPSGSLVIAVPQHRWLWSQADDYAGHVRRYRRAELVDKVRAAGLQVEYVSSFVSLLIPLMWLARSRKQAGEFDPDAEFRIPAWLNTALEGVMSVEAALIRAGLRFPFGGSLLLVAKKRD